MTSSGKNEVLYYEIQSPQTSCDLDPLSCLSSYNSDIEVIIDIYEGEDWGNKVKGMSCLVLVDKRAIVALVDVLFPFIGC